MEVKKGALRLYSKDFNGLGKKAVVSLSFDVKCSSCILNSIKCPGGCACFPQGAEEAVVCSSLYFAVKNTLCGNIARIKNSKVTSVCHGYADGQFLISWQVAPALSTIRKSLGLALKVLNPSKMYPIYTKLMQFIKHAPNREAFNYAANEVTKSLKKSLDIMLIGAMKFEAKDKAKENLTAALAVLSNHFNPTEADGKAQKPGDHKDCNHEGSVELKAKGTDAYFAVRFLEEILRQPPVKASESVIVQVKQSSWDAANKKLKNSIANYIAKFAKVPDLALFVAFDAVERCLITADTARDLVGKKLTPADIGKQLSKIL